MEHLSIDDFIRAEKHLSEKLEEACGLFKKVCETFNRQPLSRVQFQRIYGNACQLVQNLFNYDCRVLERFCPGYQPFIRQITPKAMMKIKILHDLEWDILVSQLS